jgi:hypothetical protein
MRISWTEGETGRGAAPVVTVGTTTRAELRATTAMEEGMTRTVRDSWVS